MAVAKQIERIFGSLEAAGFPRAFQKTLLPEWVTADVLSDEAASSEVAAILAKRLGLRASPLFNQAPNVESLRRRDTKYKRSIPSRHKNLFAATSVAASIAESISAACGRPFVSLPADAGELRRHILESFKGYWVGLRNLLMTCWASGIPVVYLAELGNGVSKMDGMVVHTAGRPVIVLSKGSDLWAWQLFILAHEVAHIALGHVCPDEILIDEELGVDSYALEDEDDEERAADTFAIELLNGRRDATYTTSDAAVNGAELADAAFTFGKKNRIDPGHIALNYAHKSGDWKTGVAAARRLQGQNPPAQDVINQAMWENILPETLPEDTLEFLRRVTGSLED
ncbi:hypothetical protein AYM40_20955 [Paraburkholderia phytofirmans OLGA172]|uniref:IrrE N-terminal-like domain-containing protein n=1 Tax=Paraburkholderia phytofirmans OLGA172 TaxID=1417228 RepID=A0A160FQE4_9BURK|nr:hypothetical protein [Paraburkholderia phytofirmans]ANB74922.1 hypothetical protein AYM40_20955 [Paraburkholderia phytofirmans OLGA172]